MTFADGLGGGYLEIEIHLALGADVSADPLTWAFATDITNRGLNRAGVRITGGRADEQTETDSCTIALELLNDNGDLTPRNPMSPYYPLLRQSTPIRVRFRPDGVTWYEFVGIIDELPTRWDLSQRDQWIPVTASGTLKPILTNRGPATSRVYNTIMAQGDVLTDYWSMEDGALASIGGSALANRPPLAVDGTVDFATSAGPAGSGPLPGNLLQDFGQLSAPGAATTSNSWFVGFWFRAVTPLAGEYSGGTVLEFTVPGHSAYALFDVYWNGGAQIILGATTAAGAAFSLVAANDVSFDAWHFVLVGAWQNGTAVEYNMWVDGVSTSSLTHAATTNGATGLRDIIVSPTSQDLTAAVGLPISPIACGHLLVLSAFNDPAATTLGKGTSVASAIYQAGVNLGGWSAVDELDRVCARLGLTATYTAPGAGVATYPMGPDGIATDVARLRAIEAVTGGVLYELPSGPLRLDTAADRYDLPVALTLDYGAGDVAPPLEPVEDTTLTRNDVTATRPDGASARFTLDAGPMSTSPTAPGVGSRPGTVDVNPYSDRALIAYAGYAVARGTVDAERYLTVHVDCAARPGLIAAALAAARPSKRIAITNPPTGQGYYNAPDLLVEGFEIFLDFYSLDVVYNATPYAPYVGFGLVDALGAPAVGGVAGFLIPTSCVTTATMPATSAPTSVTMTTIPLWNTDASNFPADVEIDGEVMRATAVSGAANPQTLTLTRAINGVVKAHAVGAEITIRAPGYLTMECDA